MIDIKGIYVALATPMDSSGAIDQSQLKLLTDKLIVEGVHGLVPLGTTGEFYTMDDSERDQVLSTVLETNAGRVPVFAGVNAGSTMATIAMAQRAEHLGCDGIMLGAPYYSLPDEKALVAHLQAVITSINIPVILYNYPDRTGVDMTLDVIEQIIDLPNLAGIKESTGDASRFNDVVATFGERISVLCGCDSLAFEMFCTGAKGWIGGGANFAAAQQITLYKQIVEQQDLSAGRATFYKQLPLLRYLENCGKYTQAVKAGIEHSGISVGLPRLPLQKLSVDEYNDLIDAIGQSGGASGK